MKKIYTKTGDEGLTSLRGGERVAKDDPRIEANGQLDMLNSLLGVIINSNEADSQAISLLCDVQRELMTVMSHVATPQGQLNPRPLHCAELTRRMEEYIDGKALGPLPFVSPRSMLHVARAQCRTAERRLWTLHRTAPLDASILSMMNRLSDCLFVMAEAFHVTAHCL